MQDMDREEFDQWDEERRQRRAERHSRRAERRRSSPGERPFSVRDQRKDKVLHTRISEDLDDTLRTAAEELRVPVSNLVRNVLEDVFDVVETVTENVEDLLEDLMGESHKVRERFGHRRRTRETYTGRVRKPDPTDIEGPTAEVVDTERPEFSDVVGWQPMILNRTRSCVDCGTALDVGERAFVGLTQDGLSPHTLCRDCADERF